MELENKKFRCHISIIFEECATFIASALVLAFLNISDFFTDDTTGTDALYGALVIVGIIFALLLFVLLRGILRWRKTTITIDREAIVWERDTLNKKKLTIGIKNISSINVERNIFERIIGTAKLKIDTNSLSTASTTDVMFLFKYEEALQYKEYLEAMVRSMEEAEADFSEMEEDGNDGDIVSEHDPDDVVMEKGSTGYVAESAKAWKSSISGNKSVGVPTSGSQTSGAKNSAAQEFNRKVTCGKNKVIAEYTSTEGEIIMHCLYDISLFSLIVGGIPTIWGIVELFRTIFSGNVNLSELFGALTIVITFGYATFYSVVGKLFRYYGLSVKRSGNRLHMKYGLLKIREYVVPVEKINAIHINQSMISRLCHRYHVTIDCVGVGDENNEIAQLTLALPYDEVIQRVSQILPEYDVSQISGVERISPKAFWHKLRGILILALLCVGFWVGATVAAEGQMDGTFVAISAVVIAVIFVWTVLAIFLQLKTEGSMFGKNHLVTAMGTFGKDIMVISYKKVQYASANRSPITKFTGLVLGQINILAAGANSIKKVPYITEDKVEYLKEKMCER